MILEKVIKELKKELNMMKSQLKQIKQKYYK